MLQATFTFIVFTICGLSLGCRTTVDSTRSDKASAESDAPSGFKLGEDHEDAAVLNSPAEGEVIKTGSNLFLSWTKSSVVDSIYIGIADTEVEVNSSPFGTHFKGFVYSGESLSVTLTPSSAGKLFVRLWSRISGVWYSKLYQFETIDAGDRVTEFQEQLEELKALSVKNKESIENKIESEHAVTKAELENKIQDLLDDSMNQTEGLVCTPIGNPITGYAVRNILSLETVDDRATDAFSCYFRARSAKQGAVCGRVNSEEEVYRLKSVVGGSVSVLHIQEYDFDTCNELIANSRDGAVCFKSGVAGSDDVFRIKRIADGALIPSETLLKQACFDTLTNRSLDSFTRGANVRFKANWYSDSNGYECKYTPDSESGTVSTITRECISPTGRDTVLITSNESFECFQDNKCRSENDSFTIGHDSVTIGTTERNIVETPQRSYPTGVFEDLAIATDFDQIEVTESSPTSVKFRYKRPSAPWSDEFEYTCNESTYGCTGPLIEELGSINRLDLVVQDDQYVFYVFFGIHRQGVYVQTR